MKIHEEITVSGSSTRKSINWLKTRTSLSKLSFGQSGKQGDQRTPRSGLSFQTPPPQHQSNGKVMDGSGKQSPSSPNNNKTIMTIMVIRTVAKARSVTIK